MSRGRTGLIKAIKEVFREVKFFGDAEIAALRKELEAHKLQLEQLRAARQERERREEALALLAMRNAVEHLQRMEGLLAEQDQRLEALTDEMACKAVVKQERDMMTRAMNVMQGLKMQDVVVEEEEAFEEHLARMQAQLKARPDAAGRGQPSPSGAVGSGNGSSHGGSGKPGGQQR